MLVSAWPNPGSRASRTSSTSCSRSRPSSSPRRATPPQAAPQREAAGARGRRQGPPRPSPALWALNKLAREDGALIEAFLEAAADLREATSSGGDVRAATAPERAAESRVTKAVAAILRAEGQGRDGRRRAHGRPDAARCGSRRRRRRCTARGPAPARARRALARRCPRIPRPRPSAAQRACCGGEAGRPKPAAAKPAPKPDRSEERRALKQQIAAADQGRGRCARRRALGFRCGPRGPRAAAARGEARRGARAPERRCGGVARRAAGTARRALTAALGRARPLVDGDSGGRVLAEHARIAPQISPSVARARTAAMIAGSALTSGRSQSAAQRRQGASRPRRRRARRGRSRAERSDPPRAPGSTSKNDVSGSLALAVAVDADHDAVARLQRDRRAVGLLVDRPLVEARLDRRDRAADALHLRQELPCPLPRARRSATR